MKKNLRRVLTVVLSLSLTVGFPCVASANAATNEYSALIDEIGQSYQLFQELGFTASNLSQTLLLGAEEPGFWGDVAPQSTGSSELDSAIQEANIQWVSADTVASDLLTSDVPSSVMADIAVLRDGDPYDGNPPHSAAEQADRMAYLWNVYKTYYSAPKYNPNPYLVYLYISHYTENINYDRTAPTPNFDQVFAHVISTNDINAFNNFIQGSGYASIAAGISNAGTVYSLVDAVTNGVDILTGEIYDANEELEAGVNAVRTLATTEYGDLVDEILLDVAQAFSDDFSNSDDPETLIENMNQQLEHHNGIEGITEAYVGVMQDMLINTAFMSVGPGFIDGVFAAAELYGSSISVAHLAVLYSSYNIRQTDRLMIHYGLRPWP
jgi:hypothetical protein